MIHGRGPFGEAMEGPEAISSAASAVRATCRGRGRAAAPGSLKVDAHAPVGERLWGTLVRPLATLVPLRHAWTRHATEGV